MKPGTDYRRVEAKQYKDDQLFGRVFSLSVGFQSIKAALTNPIRSLRSE